MVPKVNEIFKKCAPLLLLYPSLVFARALRSGSGRLGSCFAIVVLGLATCGASSAEATPASGSAAPPSAPASLAPDAARATGNGYVVEVVNVRGEPLAGADVEGLVEVNPGPVASTCCMEKSYAHGTTEKDGRLRLPAPPHTFRPVHVRVAYRDWPPRKVPLGGGFALQGSVRIVIGPIEDVPVRLDLPAACLERPPTIAAQPSFAQAPFGPPPDTSGEFVVRRIPPWAMLTVAACHQFFRVPLADHPERPVVVTQDSAIGR